MIVIKEDRTMERIREQAEKWKAQIREAARKNTRDYTVMMWAGYLNGLRMAGTISFAEYGVLYREMKNYVEGFKDGVRNGGKE